MGVAENTRKIFTIHAACQETCLSLWEAGPEKIKAAEMEDDEDNNGETMDEWQGMGGRGQI